jgi:tetratricopeptide (TPR) repeat protein
MASRSKARALRSRIPLRHRLPNPSAVFVGREDEIAWLATTLERAPVAVLCGPGGVGKTALVLRTLQTTFREQRERTLYLAIPADEPPDQVRLALAHLLARAAGAEDTVDIAGLRGDPEELTAMALDLAEEGPFWVVLDDLQHTDREEMGELLRQLSAYARDSRFIATTRASLASTGLDGQILALSRMGHGALAEMARALEPKGSSADLQAAVNAAVGSPWLLKQYLAAGAEGLALTRSGVLESVSEPARALLETLSHLEVPLSREVVATLAPLPADEELTTLVARGLLIDEDGLRVHDQVGDFLFPPGTAGEAERRARIAAQLSTHEEPEAVLEALRLDGLAGDVDAIVALLDERGHELMGLGCAPRVWQLVERTTDPRVGLWQLRCAAELGNATVLGAVREPQLRKGEDQLAWAATQFLLGEQEEARRIALEVAGGGDEGLEADARLLAARCLLHLGRAVEARAELEVASGGESTGATAALCALLDACLDADGAAAETAAVGSRVSEAGDAEALLDVAMAHYRLGDRARADQVVEQVLATPRGGRAALLLSRRALLLRARIAVDRGALDHARELIELVRPFARGTSILRPLLIEIDGSRRLAVGELTGLEAALERGLEVARGGEVSVSARLEMLLRQLAELREGAELGVGTQRTSPSPWEPRVQRALREALHAARRELAIGDPMDGIEAARRAQEEAAHAGLKVLEAEALLLLGDGLFAAMSLEELGTATEALTHLADSLGSRRLRHHVAFYEGHDDPAVLERLAAEEDVAPRVARRARALLGLEAVADGIDEQVLAAARTAWTDQQILTLGEHAEAHEVAWGLDALRSSVWLPDGRTVSLARKPLLFRVLTTLADHGGAASKETLINEAWDEREYHPIRHDPKLHVSIRALRKAIEDDPSQPARLLTTEEGYTLGGVVRRLLPVD